MSRWQALEYVCSRLRAEFLDGTAPPPVQPSWELLIGSSSHHNVLPAFAWCYRDDTGVPDEVRDFFEASIALNNRRNELIMGAFGRVAAALNAIDVEPIPLKGAATLVAGLFPNPGLRILGDLDILIPAERSDAVLAAVRNIGFEDAESLVGPEYHHLKPLCDRETGTRIELHRRLSTAGDAIVPADWFVQKTDALLYRGARIRLPDVTRRVVHNIVHNQLDSRGFRRGTFELRQLLECARLRVRHPHDIDWEEIDRRFCSAGQGVVLATYLGFAETLLGQPMPGLSHKPRPDAIGIMRRDAGQSSWRTLAVLRQVAASVGAFLRRHPGAAIRVFDLRKLPARMRFVKDIFNRRKW